MTARKRKLDVATLDDKPIAVIEWGSSGYGGAGWYYWSEDYPDEGSTGAFATEAECAKDARKSGFKVEAKKREQRTYTRAEALRLAATVLAREARRLGDSWQGENLRLATRYLAGATYLRKLAREQKGK